jgi:hypothetical protein
MLQQHQLENPEPEAIIGAAPAKIRNLDGRRSGWQYQLHPPHCSDQPFKAEEFTR